MNDNARHSSEHNDHYTPYDIVEASRSVLGHIDLDPASCELANKIVRADFILTAEDNGFVQDWAGNVFLNPPGGLCDRTGHLVIQRKKGIGPCTETGACGIPAPHTHEGVDSSQKMWWFKLAKEYVEGRVEAAIFICFSIELIQTSQVATPDDLPLPVWFPICFPRIRLKYVSEKDGVLKTGGSPTHSSMIVFLPPEHDDIARVKLFHETFKAFGATINK